MTLRKLGIEIQLGDFPKRIDLSNDDLLPGRRYYIGSDDEGRICLYNSRENIKDIFFEDTPKGYRNPFQEKHLEFKVCGDGIEVSDISTGNEGTVIYREDDDPQQNDRPIGRDGMFLKAREDGAAYSLRILNPEEILEKISPRNETHVLFWLR